MPETSFNQPTPPETGRGAGPGWGRGQTQATAGTTETRVSKRPPQKEETSLGFTDAPKFGDTRGIQFPLV